MKNMLWYTQISRQNEGGEEGREDSLGFVIDSESGELFSLHFLPGMEDG